MMTSNLLFLLNYYTCMDESFNSFSIDPLALEEYILPTEDILEATNVDDTFLGKLYLYH